jgi:hypothetical protein
MLYKLHYHTYWLPHIHIQMCHCQGVFLFATDQPLMASQLLELFGGYHLSALSLQKPEGAVTDENWHSHCLQDEKHGYLGTTLDALVMEVH